MKKVHFLCLVLFLISACAAYAQEFKGVSVQDAKALEETISNYHKGFISGDPKITLSAIGSEFMIFNGNFSGEPVQWEAHLFRGGDDLPKWVTNLTNMAAPHQNRFKVLHINIRNNAAVVVTQDTGSNKFRNWKDEKVTWLLGKRNDQWKLTGFFIRDIKNPE